MKLYIRFGEIPVNERSGIYAIDQGRIGEEAGVSCYECIKDENGHYRVVMPPNLTRSTGVSMQWAFDDWRKKRCNTYIITGVMVGKGSDNEPLLRNVNVIEKLNYEDYKNL